MEWIEISKQRPPPGELIWVWDQEKNRKFLIRYSGSKKNWEQTKDSSKFPIWAHLNSDEKDKEMSRCQYCKKLTHCEDLYVSYKMKDFEKVRELIDLVDWTPKYLYDKQELEKVSCDEYGKLKCGDIYVHFVLSR